MGLNIRKQATGSRSGNGSGIRVGKTSDGRYVPIDHPDAAFLAYTEQDEVPDDVLAKLRAKQAPRSTDKQASKPADKSRGSRASRQKSADVSADADTDRDEATQAAQDALAEDESSE